MSQDFQWQGRERCQTLLAIRKEIQEFTSLSSQEQETLVWAISKLLEQYGCIPNSPSS